MASKPHFKRISMSKIFLFLGLSLIISEPNFNEPWAKTRGARSLTKKGQVGHAKRTSSHKRLKALATRSLKKRFT